jgi:hypothetical protein
MLGYCMEKCGFIDCIWVDMVLELWDLKIYEKPLRETP